MAFVTVPASAFVDDVTVIPSSWLNYVRASLPDAIDGVGGGTYNIGAGNTIDFPAGGGDINIDAPLTFTDGELPTGGVLDVGGDIDVGPGGNIHLEGFGLALATIECKASSIIMWDANSIGLVKPSANFNVQGSLNIAGSSGDRTIYVGLDGTGPGYVVLDGTGTASGSGMVVQAGAYLNFSGTNYNTGTGTWQWSAAGTLSMASTSRILVGSTAKIQFTAGGAIQETVALTGTQPTKTADPGFNNALCATNQCKAWAAITTNGSGTITLDDGYNVASVAIVGGQIELTFARAMTNSTYAVVANAISTGVILGTPTARATGTCRVAATYFSYTAPGPSTPSAQVLDVSSNGVSISWTVVVFARQ